MALKTAIRNSYGTAVAASGHAVTEGGLLAARMARLPKSPAPGACVLPETCLYSRKYRKRNT
ncbi:hypothetical protein KL86DES1_20479 [uncultured Desulfovibrio sp.]|uniref:Uncharacterized protein n=1 Tax=uncultured Desulfovibrio sp. TaxID=167968 RepID=A0A212L3Z4_9BACT|nr:hypothetical protein KL86DES1_20479 [uncultured Desulfovibrio sp.]VZH33382.1 conserved protein of unknown function [Desulfovibrio sp. 86]